MSSVVLETPAIHSPPRIPTNNPHPLLCSTNEELQSPNITFIKKMIEVSSEEILLRPRLNISHNIAKLRMAISDVMFCKA